MGIDLSGGSSEEELPMEMNRPRIIVSEDRRRPWESKGSQKVGGSGAWRAAQTQKKANPDSGKLRWSERQGTKKVRFIDGKEKGGVTPTLQWGGRLAGKDNDNQA